MRRGNLSKHQDCFASLAWHKEVICCLAFTILSSSIRLLKRMLQKVISLLIPYATIGIGLFIFHSAWLAIFGYHIGIASVILVSRKRIPVKRLFKSNNYKTPVIMSVIGASGGVLLYVLWPFLAVPSNIGSYTQSIGITEQTWSLFIAYYVLVNPVLEEYFWRGLLGNNSNWITANDLFFSGYHVLVLAGKMGAVWLLVVFLLLSLSAWFWRQVNKFSEGLLPSVVSHVTADISVMLTIYLMTVHG